MKLARTLLVPAVVVSSFLLSPAPTFGSSAPVSAQFDDAAVSAWPEADLSRPYTVNATNAAFNSDADSARIRLDRPGAGADGTVDETTASSADVTFRVTADVAATGFGQSAHVILRAVETSNYRLRIRLDPDGHVLLRAIAVAGIKSRGLSTEMVVPGVRFTPGRWIKVRAQVLGTNPTVIRAKVWDPASAQPTSWRYVVSDKAPALQTSGAIGLGARLSLSSSSAPVTFEFDDIVAQHINTAPDNSPTASAYSARPYTNGSAWNTPIGAGAALDAHSTELVATIGLSANGGLLSSDPTQYSYPVYVADTDTARHTMSTTYTSRRFNVDGSFTSLGYSVPQVPIDGTWGSSSGSDAQLIVVDPATGDEWDIFGYGGPGTFAASRMSHYVAGTQRDGAPRDYNSRGAGVPYLAGLIRPWEIAQGRIDHAIAFGYQFPARGRCVLPASKTDGQSDLAMAIPEGARLQLNPSLGAADFDRWGLGATGRIIARAMQRYGIILIDYAGRPKLYAENVAANVQGPTSWSQVGGLSATTVAPIPFTALRVLDLPDGYWSGATGGQIDGDCYR